MPFALHVLAIAACMAGFAVSNSVLAWMTSIVLLLILPISQSMRLNLLGRSPFWPVLPLVGAFILLFQLLSTLASIGGAPSGSPTPTEELVIATGLIGLGIMAAISLICLLPEHWVAHPSRRAAA